MTKHKLTPEDFGACGLSGAFLTGVGEFLLLLAPTLVTDVLRTGEAPGT